MESEDSHRDATSQNTRSKNMLDELDESSLMLERLTKSLNTVTDLKDKPQTPPSSSTHDRKPHLSHSTSNASSVFSEMDDRDHMTGAQEAASNGVNRRSRTLSENAARHQVVSSLSTSEPDLVNLDDNDDVPPPLPPRDPDMLLPPATPSHDARSHGSFIGNRMVRGSSEHSLLTASLNVGPGHRSPFHHGGAMMASPAHQTRSALSTPERKKHSNAMDHSSLGTPKKLSVGKKSNTFGRYSPVDHQEGISKGSKKDKSKSRWNGLKEKMKFKSKIKHSASTHEELGASPREARSQSIPSMRRNNIATVTRKTSIGPEVLLSVAVDVPDSGVSSPSRIRQRALSLQVNAVTPITKIFSVIGCWQENYYEVRKFNFWRVRFSFRGQS